MNVSSRENTVQFLDNCIDILNGKQHEMVTQSPNFIFDVDVSARIKRNEGCKVHYKEQLMQMNFKGIQIDNVL